MRSFTQRFSREVDKYVNSTVMLIISVSLFLLTFLFTSFHYLEIFPGNNLYITCWVLSVITLLFSLFPKKIPINKVSKGLAKNTLLIIGIITTVYLVSHLWNFNSAPWNQNGLFDDAAWDIYFAKNHVFNGTPFQAAYFDDVGNISREVVFHYYISTFFKLFGYNLFIFNISLLLLGYITVMVTSLLVYKVFNNVKVTLTSFLILNFFPLHYMHIFMGHRYAIAAPLMVLSLYFLYTSFLNNSYFRAVLSSLFASLCLSSAVMGKQYILGLWLSSVLILIFGKKRHKSRKYYVVALFWIMGFLITASPILTYILFNYDLYVIREKGLLGNFILQYKDGGFNAIIPYIEHLSTLFFAKYSPQRQFLPDYYIIPLVYYLLLVPGFLLALLKTRYEIILLSFIPVLAAFVSGPYDFRVLLAVPVWVIGMSYVINSVFTWNNKKYKFIKYTVKFLVVIIIFMGVYSSVVYILNVSRDPNYLYLLPHKDVAVSRLVQDIIAGEDNPSDKMKRNEFMHATNLMALDYDTLVCPYSAYAIMHLYLQDFNDKEVLSFCNQGIQLLKEPIEILENNLVAISRYAPQNKDIKLIWEVSHKSEGVIDIFRKYNKYGSDEIISGVVDGVPYTVYILTIESSNIESFQNDVKYIDQQDFFKQEVSPMDNSHTY